MKDQFSLSYVKNGIMYPVALSDAKNTVLQEVIPILLFPDGKVFYLEDQPLGKAVMVGPKKEIGAEDRK